MKRITGVFLAANLVGILIVASVVYHTFELARSEERPYFDGVDGISFYTTAAPVLLFFAFAGSLWALKVLYDIAQKRQFESLYAFAAVLCSWAIAFFSLRTLSL